MTAAQAVQARSCSKQNPHMRGGEQQSSEGGGPGNYGGGNYGGGQNGSGSSLGSQSSGGGYSLSGLNGAQNQSGGELTALAQMSNKGPNLLFRCNSRQSHCSPFARVPGHAESAVLLQPSAGGDKISKHLRELGNQGLTGRRRQIIALQHRLAHGPEMTMTRHDAVECTAQSVAVAIDRARWAEVAGTISGDDTIFVATEHSRAQRKLLADELVLRRLCLVERHVVRLDEVTGLERIVIRSRRKVTCVEEYRMLAGRNHAACKRLHDLANGVYAMDNSFSVPKSEADPYATDLVAQYWGSVRALIRERLSEDE